MEERVRMRNKIISCMIIALMIITIFVIEVPKDVSAQVTEEWVARYNGPANGWDSARDIVIDNEGNVYITGRSQKDVGSPSDYTTIKYDSEGNELWVARYNGPNNDSDWPTAIALDSIGNVYVTGHSEGIGTSYDYATIKYDSSGNELWVARYNGPCNGADKAEAIAIDISGNVYITGGSLQSGKDSDFATIKYDQNGNELWVARYDSHAGDYGDFGRDITLDLSGNVYVTGYSMGISTKEDYVTIKYDSNGSELWSERYNGPGNDLDYALAMKVDPLGNVYVSGRSEGISTDSDYATIKYDTYGNCLWIARYNGPGNLFDSARAIAIDSSGNTYVTGGSEGNGTKYDYATIAYDSSGNQLWVARYNGPDNGHDYARAITLDSFGNIYVTGDSWNSSTSYDVVTIAYDKFGNELWVISYDSSVGDKDGGYAITIDSSRNVYVSGYSWGNGTYPDFIAIKYSQEFPGLQASIDIDPDTLNLKSKGRWITCYIDLPGNDVNDIDISTILLEDTIPAEWGDIQNDTLMVKFDRSEIEDMLSPGTYNLKVSGELTEGTSFEGYSDEIRVIDPGR
jgi:uncharacterized delta-60 repeat protein